MDRPAADPERVPAREAGAVGDPGAADRRGAGAAVSPAPVAAPTVAAPAPRAARGIVVDAATGAPIEGARVLFALVGGPKDGSWFGDTTDAEGRFRHEIRDPRDLEEAGAELRVSKDGYELLRVAPADGEMRIELRPRGAALLPGRVTGTVRSADGTPFAGEIEVDGYDESGGNASQFAVAGPDGAFVLEGVPAGRWQLSWARGRTVTVEVPGGGEARADLRAAPAGERGGFVVTDVDPSKVSAEDPAAAKRLAALRATYDAVQADDRLDDGARERIARAIALEIQDLARAARLALPRSEVVVRIPATSGRAWVRLETKPRQFWRVEVEGGAARFPSVPAGVYTAVLVEPGRTERTAEVVAPTPEGGAAPEFR